MRAVSVLVMLSIVGLAGCSDSPGGSDGGVDGGIDQGGVTLKAGRGAIEGLLVDDRFRPIDLEDEPQTEFQAKGFVLLQETGQQVQTDENGEFAILDLEPGSYTLRATAEGHEATPARVVVSEGVFAEAQVIARRVISEGGTIITNEYAVFIPCAADYVANGGNIPCDLDFSSDGYSSEYGSNLTAITDLTFMVTELRANQPSGYHIQIRPYANPNYATAIWEGDYVKIVNEKGVANTEWVDEVYGGPNIPFDNDRDFQTIFFVEHAPARQAVPGTCCGVGATMGVKGQFLQSIFVGEPDVDIDAYCGLC